MAARGISQVLTYRAWDTVANAPKTGDSANHTLRWVKDGTSSAPTNAASEVDSTNAKGIYKITLTAAECDCLIGTLCGVSSTTGIALFGPEVGFVPVPLIRAGLATGGGGSTITLDAAATQGDSYYNRTIVEIISGTGVGQARLITGYVSATQVATVNRAWVTNPDNTSRFIIYPGEVDVETMNNVNASPVTTIKAVQGLTTADTIATYTGNTPQTGDAYARLGAPAGASTAADIAAVKGDSAAIKVQTDKLTFTIANKVDTWGAFFRTGTAQAGAANTITLDAGAPATVSLYFGLQVTIIGGTGVGQQRLISSYNGAQVASVRPNWTVNPDNTSVFLIAPWGAVDVEQYGSSAVSTTAAGIPDVNVKNIAGTLATLTGGLLDVNMKTITAGIIAAASFAANALDAVWSTATRALTDKTGFALGAGGVDGASIASITAAVWAQTVADLAAVPGASATILLAINWLYMMGRNQLESTATTQTLRKNDNATAVGTAAQSDDTVTFTRGKFS